MIDPGGFDVSTLEPPITTHTSTPSLIANTTLLPPHAPPADAILALQENIACSPTVDPPTDNRRHYNPYTHGNSHTRFLQTIANTSTVFETPVSTSTLPPIVATAFKDRALPPQHIQRRLKTIYTIPQEDFPEYQDHDEHQPVPPPTTTIEPASRNQSWGDNINVPKPPKHTRIYFQNVYGLRITTAGLDKWQDCLRSMQEYQCDIFGFAETNCNWSRNRVRHRLQAAASHLMPQLCIAPSHNSYVHDSDYLPGGTLMCTQGSWGGRIQTTLNDPHHMGRWTGNMYKVQSGNKLAIITAYRVCKQDSAEGVYSSYKQQQLSLRARYGPQNTPCPRHAFISDLIDYILSLGLTSHDHLLIMLDANEVVGEDAYGILNLIEQLRLVDLLERHHQQSCDIATHSNSHSRRIDYLLGSSNMVQFNTQCGYLPFQQGIDSDHRACFIELNRDFVDGRARLHQPPTRLIGYNTNKKEVLKYKEFVHSEFTKYDIFQRAQELFERASFNMHNEPLFLYDLNAIDREVTKIILHAEETQCSKKPPFLWSPAIHNASLRIKYWALKQNSDRKKKDRSVQLQVIYDQLDKEDQKDIDATMLAHTTSSTTKLHRAKVDKQRLQLRQKNARAATKRQRMEADAKFYDVTPEQALKRIGMKEESAHLFRYLEKVYTKSKGAGIMHIEIPYKDVQGNLTDNPLNATEWVKVTDPDEFVPMLIARNISHFGQAKQSPFATEPLLEVFGYTGTTASATALVSQGIIPASCTAADVHTGAQDILHKLADRQNTPSTSFHVDQEEFWSAFKKWDERTSTSPSNRHLGHYKVLHLSDGNEDNYKKKNFDQDDFDDDKPPNPSDAIQSVYFGMSEAACKFHSTTLQAMRYRIRTSTTGDSATFHRSSSS